MELPLFGVEAGLSLGSSVLGSIIRGLDPDPPDPRTSIGLASSRGFAGTPEKVSKVTQAGVPGIWEF